MLVKQTHKEWKQQQQQQEKQPHHHDCPIDIQFGYKRKQDTGG